MKYLSIILFIAAILICTDANSQSIESCDSIYYKVDEFPEYSGGSMGFLKYFNKEVAPIISNCMKRDEVIIASLRIELIINSSGKVIDASFPRPFLTSQCKDELKAKFMTMTGFNPGKIKGKEVCNKFYMPIGCLKWQE